MKRTTMSRRNKFILLLLTVALVLSSCNRKIIYSHYEPTPLSGWEKSDTLSFSIDPIKYDGTYSEEIGLRINSAYPFMGLTLIASQYTQPAHILRTDTLHAHLIDNDGNIQGTGVGYYQYHFKLATLQLYANDTLYVNIRHNMKREILPGISDVGITLRKEE